MRATHILYAFYGVSSSSFLFNINSPLNFIFYFVFFVPDFVASQEIRASLCAVRVYVFVSSTVSLYKHRLCPKKARNLLLSIQYRVRVKRFSLLYIAKWVNISFLGSLFNSVNINNDEWVLLLNEKCARCMFGRHSYTFYIFSKPKGGNFLCENECDSFDLRLQANKIRLRGQTRKNAFLETWKTPKTSVCAISYKRNWVNK